MSSTTQHINWEIKPVTKWPGLQLREVWQYKDLLVRLVKRDLIVSYRQTILGPLWVFIEPLIATLIYYVVFGAVMRISTDGVPPILFYLSGIVFWNYFSDTVAAVSYTFVQNATIFGKVYFPRLIVPFSMVLSKLVRLLIQLCLLLVICITYHFNGKPMHINISLLWLPILVLLVSAFGLGLGLILTSLAAKYRDVQNFLMFGLRVLMFATPIFFPYSLVPAKYKLFIGLNPLTPIIEIFRHGMFGTNHISVTHFLYSISVIVILMVIGIIYYNVVEQNVIDTV